MNLLDKPIITKDSFKAMEDMSYFIHSLIFDDLLIAGDEQYRKYLNHYDVIYLDMTGVIGEASITDIVPYIQRNVVRELAEQYPKLKIVEGFAATLANAAEIAGNKLVMIIDEWDMRQLEKQKMSRIYKENIWSFYGLCLKTAE